MYSVAPEELSYTRSDSDAGINEKREPRCLPFSEDAEKGVLCSLLLSTHEVSDLARTALSSDAFYIPAHRLIYETVLELVDSGRPVDFVTLRQKFRDRAQLENIGGMESLSELFDFIPTAANAAYYIAIVREKYLLRKMILTCGRITSECYDQQDEVVQLMDWAEKEIFQVTSDGPSFELVPIKSRVVDAIDRIEQIFESRGALTGLSTGLVDLDKITGGLQPGDMIVLAGRPSMGKTALAINNIAAHVTIELKKPAAVFSLEMSADALVQRILCSRARVNLQKLRDGFLSGTRFPKPDSSGL